MRRPTVGGRLPGSLGLLLAICGSTALPARAQTPTGSNLTPYELPSTWQQAAISALNRQLPTDSGYWALGPLDPAADLPDTTRLLRTTVRVLVPGPDAVRSAPRRLWVPSGGVALEGLQPADTLPYEPPPGYPGRFLQGSLAGQQTYVQVLTVQEHRWLLWADRVLLTEAEEPIEGPLARYSRAVAGYLAALDSGRTERPAPAAADFDLATTFDLFGDLPDHVIRDRSGYVMLFDGHDAFELGDVVRDVDGVVAAPALRDWLQEEAQDVILENRGGEPAVQRRYRAYRQAAGRWTGLPVLTGANLASLTPGRYAYAVDRYHFIRVGRIAGPDSAAVSPALLVHNDPVRIAGELVVRRGLEGGVQLAELNIRTEEYLFSNYSLTLYEDVRERSDAYLQATVGHLLRALERAGVPHDDTLIRKF